MTGQFRKQPLKSHSGMFTAALGIPSRDLAARVNNRLTEFIDHFNKYVLAVHETFSRYNIEHEELDAAVTEMRQALEDLQSGEQSYQQRIASNGYLEQMFFRMYNDLARLIDERFAEYGFTQRPTPQPDMRNNLVIGDSDFPQRPEALYASTDSDSESDSDMSVIGDSVSDSSRRTYAEIRYLRGIYPGTPVKEFCVQFGISEQQYYRAMRKK